MYHQSLQLEFISFLIKLKLHFWQFFLYYTQVKRMINQNLDKSGSLKLLTELIVSGSYKC